MAKAVALALILCSASIGRVEALPCASPLGIYDNVGSSIARNPAGEPLAYYSIVAIALLVDVGSTHQEGWYYLDDHGMLSAQLGKDASKRTIDWFAQRGSSSGVGVAQLYHVAKGLPDWLKLAPCQARIK